MKGTQRGGGGRGGRGGNKENNTAAAAAATAAAAASQNSSYHGTRNKQWGPTAPNFANVAATPSPTSNANTAKDSVSTPAFDHSTSIATSQVINPQNPLLFALTNFVGLKAEVTIKNGAVYEGICHTCSTDGDVGICLKMAKKQISPRTNSANNTDGGVIKNLVIVGKDVSAISVRDVGIGVLTRGAADRESFQTDVAITGSGGDVKERPLLPWTGGSDAQDASHSTFEDSNIGRWDQFEANERLYGVKTDFNEDDYTIKLDKTGSDFKKREAEAARLATEIEKSGTGGNAHMTEERGGVATEDLDEEGRYSAVLQSGRYVPPQQRRTGSKPPNAWATPTPSIPSFNQKSPVSQTSKTPPPTQTAKPQTLAARPTPAINPMAPAASASSPAPSSAPPAPAPSVPAIAASGTANSNNSNSNSSTFSQPLISASAVKSESGPAPPIASSSKPSVLSKLSSVSDKKPISQAGKNPDELVEDVRQFAVKEQARIGREKDHLQARKRDLMKKEKDNILNDFKKFSESFQLKTPVPDELRTILRKTNQADETRVETPKMEDRKKSASSASTATTPSSTKTTTATSRTPSSSGSTAVPAATASSVSTQPARTPTPVSANATQPIGSTPTPTKGEKGKEFKFNLDAVEFRPTGPAEFVSQGAAPPIAIPFVPPPMFVPPMPPQQFMPPMPEKNGIIPEKSAFIMNRTSTAPPGAMKEVIMKNFNKRSASGAKPQQIPPTWPGKGSYKGQVASSAPEVDGPTHAMPTMMTPIMPIDPQQFAFQYAQPMQQYQYPRPNMMGRSPQAPFVPMQAFSPAPVQYFIPQFPQGGPTPMFAPQMMPPQPQPGGRVYSQKGHSMQQGYRPDMYGNLQGSGGRMPPHFIPPQFQQPPMMYPPEMIPMQPNMMIAPVDWTQQDQIGEQVMPIQDPNAQY